MIPVCPISLVMIRKPVMCDDGYMYEENMLWEWMKKHDTSPMTRDLIRSVKRCDINDVCFNSYQECKGNNSFRLNVLSFGKVNGYCKFKKRMCSDYSMVINVERVSGEGEIIVNVDEIENDLSRYCAEFIVEKYGKAVCRFREGIVHLIVKEEGKTRLEVNGNELVIVR